MNIDTSQAQTTSEVRSLLTSTATANSPRSSENNTTITYAPLASASLSQSLWNEIERGMGRLTQVYDRNPVGGFVASFVLGAVGGITIGHYAGYREPIDMMVAASLGGFGGGSALALLLNHGAPWLNQFMAARQASQHETDHIPLGSMQNPENNA
jgi:hypothetical protein